MFPGFRFDSLVPARTPTFVATGFGQPNQGPTTFRAKISPNPSMTPFTNGKNMLIAMDDTSATTLVRVDTFESNTVRVNDGGAAGAGG